MEPQVRTAAVALHGVSRRYGDGALAVHALRDVDLLIEPGQLVVVLGPSGSGKTTLLNVIGGIDSPTAGRLTVGGHRVDELAGDELTAFRRSTIGFVFQFFNLIPTLTAQENVELVAELTGERPDERARQVLDEVGLTDRAAHFPGQLSGGEQQRVAIARAVVKEPPVLLCDEPTGALDLETGRHILALLRRLNRERGCTVLVVTHNSAIAGMADRVLRMRSGRVVDDEHVAAPVEPEHLDW